MWTEKVTWFSNEEGKKGQIKVGQFADLIVPDRDFFACPQDEIADMTSDLTIVGGRVVYGGGDFSAYDTSALPPAMAAWSPARTFGGYMGLEVRRPRRHGQACGLRLQQPLRHPRPCARGCGHAQPAGLGSERLLGGFGLCLLGRLRTLHAPRLPVVSCSPKRKRGPTRGRASDIFEVLP